MDTPDGMAVDVNGRNLFWTDTDTKRIEMIRLDGTYRRIIISHDLDAPRDISLDTVNGWIYWSDWGTNPRIGIIRKLALKKIGPVYGKIPQITLYILIERAWMDGTHREIIVKEDIAWPNGIAVDIQEQKIYWCDAKMDRIEVANVDGSNRYIVLSYNITHPFGLSVLGNYIYWTGM